MVQASVKDNRPVAPEVENPRPNKKNIFEIETVKGI